ncbi:MAG: hypothetical protein ACYSOF_02125 [Planctomycetota bacterium]|jgi:uncharacterized membrane protein
MNEKQRQALFFLVLNLAIWSILAFSGFVIYLSGIMSTLYVVSCSGCILWVGLMCFFPFSKRFRSKSKHLIDERDLKITHKCIFAGYIGIWLYFIAVSIILWFIVGPDGSIPIGAFPALLYVAMGIFSIVSNLAAWFSYRDKNINA